MALVLLPCDLPTWPTVQKQLNCIKSVQTSLQLIEIMQKLYTMCCISLDPDENDRNGVDLFSGLQHFLDEVMTLDERTNFFQVTLPKMASYALQLKHNKPLDGLQYSLQQQGDRTFLKRSFVTSILASAFFSMFPKRTVKTHPTLQDINFASLFAHLNSRLQQKKLMNIFRYFDRLNDIDSSRLEEPLITNRQVMNRKTMLSMDDWLKCDVPLCPLIIKHDGRIGQTDLNDTFQVCFSSIRIGGDVLNGGERQEDDIFCVNPEALALMIYTEALDSNEAVVVRGSLGCNNRADLSNKQSTKDGHSHLCFLDALDFRSDILAQYSEVSILRELNKCYIGFLQCPSRVRLPPVGKSFSSNPSESELPRLQKNVEKDATFLSLKEKTESLPMKMEKTELLKMEATEATNLRSRGEITNMINQKNERQSIRPMRSRMGIDRGESEDSVYLDCKNELEIKSKFRRKRQKLIKKVGKQTGSRMAMGECRDGPLFLIPKPITSLLEVPESPVPSCLDEVSSMEESFRSCQSRLSSSSSSLSSASGKSTGDGYISCTEEADTTLMTDTVSGSKSSTRLGSNSSSVIPLHTLMHNSPMSRSTRPSSPSSSSSSQSNEEPCSRMTDPFGDESELFPLRRSGSTGFILQGEEMGEEGVEVDEADLFPGEGGLEQEREWLNQFRRHRHNTHTDSRNSSSRYSFSSDFSSDLEDIYEHFEEKMTEGPVRENPAYASYGRYLKRTLSDSLTSSPTCRNYNPSETGATGKNMPISAQLRSLSLTEKMQIQERISVECAKRMIRVTSADFNASSNENQTVDIEEPVESRKKEASDINELDNNKNVTNIQMPKTPTNDEQTVTSITTGNWGCGHRQAGDPQIKAIVQWMAASKANTSNIIYYTAGDTRMVKLNIVCRVLLDRHWTVGHVANALLRFGDRRRSLAKMNEAEDVDFFNSLLPKEIDL